MFRLLVLLLILLPACGADEPGGDVEEPAYVAADDLPEIEARGELRILLPRRGRVSRLPRAANPLDFEQELNELLGFDAATADGS